MHENNLYTIHSLFFKTLKGIQSHYGLRGKNHLQCNLIMLHFFKHTKIDIRYLCAQKKLNEEIECADAYHLSFFHKGTQKNLGCSYKSMSNNLLRFILNKK